MTIEVANESGVPVDEIVLVSVARYVLDRMRINPLAELSILLVDVEAMTELHVKWMDEPGPTSPVPARRCWVMWCCARRSPPSRPPRPVTRCRTSCTC